MNLQHPATAGLVSGPYDEGALRAALESARASLPDDRADLAVAFLTTPLMAQTSELMEVLQVHARASCLIGCTGTGVISNGLEVEEGPAVAFALLRVPGSQFKPFRIAAADVEEAHGPAWWHAKTGVDWTQTRGWLAFADPYSLDSEGWLHQWNEAYPSVPTVGGLAGGGPSTTRTHIFLNQEVYSEGAVAVSVSGQLGLETTVSQGCRPIGRPWTVTAADRNLIQRIGNLPALTVLQNTFDDLPAADKARAGGNIFVGLAMNEYQEEHRRGDFLVRNLLAADPKSGVVAVGARVRVGQTLQFQFRDGSAADEDLSSVLSSARERLNPSRVIAACLCTCAGRGSRLFGHPNHDAQLVHTSLGAPLPLAGLFCNGEIGPVGGRNYVHGYSASTAFFVSGSGS
ncbi:MAG: FIST C-terminal domain-containing protein [Verrucomicrobiales bacterium]|nr:FIST C-terminal domain-containing protein [Verrucomicrobiales bacterium]